MSKLLRPRLHQALLLGLSIATLSVSVQAQKAPTGVAEPHLAAGLRYADGKPHVTPPPNRVTGKTINVVDFGADPADNGTDDTLAITKAMATAAAGDEIYFPNGVYNLISPHPDVNDANVVLKDGVNLRGQSEAGSKLVSSFDHAKRYYTVIRGMDVKDVMVSQLTVSSVWNRKFSSDPRVENPDRGGPFYAISVASQRGLNQRITFEHVTVERFSRVGIRVSNGSSDVVIRNCTARDATDVAGGGAGYGYTFEGGGWRPGTENPYLGTPEDNYFNVLENSKAIGPYIRHGIIIQYWAHNNVVRNSTFTDNVYDAIDLHGEDEYLNEVHGNTISGVSQGAGIGIGNSGASHDRTGPWNWIHHNTISSSKRGLSAEYGTQANVIEDNIFQAADKPYPLDPADPHSGSVGLFLGKITNFIIRRNQIINNKAPDFSAILFVESRAMKHEPAGQPTNNLFEANVITGNTGAGAKAVRLAVPGADNKWVGNVVSGNTDNKLP